MSDPNDCVVCMHRHDVITLVHQGERPDLAIDISFMSVFLMLLTDMPLPVMIKKLCAAHKNILDGVHRQHTENQEKTQ